MLLVTGINGQTEMLCDFKEVRRKRRVNGEHSLNFYQLNTPEVADAYKLLDKRSVVTIPETGDEYIVLGISKVGHYGKRINAMHVFLDGFISQHKYELLNGTINFKQFCDFLFVGSGWTYIINGAFAPHRFENFGRDSKLALLQKGLERYKAEFSIDNKNKIITFKNEIGKTTESQFRYGHNLQTFNEETDMSNFCTVIRGFGKRDDETEFSVEYKSPLVSVYGEIHQKSIDDDRYKYESSLLEACKNNLNDTPLTKFNVSVLDLYENGLKMHPYDYGDYVYMLYEEADVAVQIRIVEVIDDPVNNSISPTFELSTFKTLRTASAIQAQFQQTQRDIQQLMDDEGNLSLALKRLYMTTETFADNTGVWYIDPNDKNRYVHIGAGGLDVHRGLIRVEREDGFATIIGGKIQYGFDIAGHYPPYRGINVVEDGWWLTSTHDVLDSCQFYTFEHKTRYVKLKAQIFTESGGEVEIAMVSSDSGQQIMSKASSTQTSAPSQNDDVDLVYDLGVPTGELKSFYLRMRNKVKGKKAYARVFRVWLEG
ncbi:phage tail protein [Bacillus cereus]|uniref:phage tail protein n=1 Tax=Bacillus cereus TaxID=1396 RepID=UPI00294E2687|nr:phage tail protein [Bacillus cereus]MDV6367399.1 phage tail protein [Bacillus cereus]